MLLLSPDPALVLSLIIVLVKIYCKIKPKPKSFLIFTLTGGGGSQVFELIQSPGPLFIEVPPTIHDLEEQRELLLVDSIMKTLPLVLFYAFINIIVGFIFFFLVSIILLS